MTAALAALPLPLRRLHPSLGRRGAVWRARPDGDAGRRAGRCGPQGLLAQPCGAGADHGRTLPRRAGRAAGAGAGRSPRHCLIALDEGAEAEEALPSALADRLALFLSLDDIALGRRGAAGAGPRRSSPPPARGCRRCACRRARPAALTGVAASLGIASLRAPCWRLPRRGRMAALRGHAGVTGRRCDDGRRTGLCPPRPAAGPRPPHEADPPPPPPTPRHEGDSDGENRPDPGDIPEELLLEAVRAALPADLLDRLAAGRAARAAEGATGSGDARPGNRRGRPLPSRPGRPRPGARIDLVATLRAAAPWQALRRAQTTRARRTGCCMVRPSDLRHEAVSGTHRTGC